MILAALAILQASAPVEVPFRVADDAIIVDVTVNGRLTSMLFDTGFGGAVVVDQSLNIGKPTGSINLRDFVGQFEAKTVKLKTLKIGDEVIAVDDMSAVQQPLSGMSQSYGMHVSGILGIEPFKHVTTEINFERSRLVFHPTSVDISKRKPDGKRTFLTKLLPLGDDSLEMDVTTSTGKKLTMALDTGNAFFATTHRDVLERVGLWKGSDKPKFMGMSMVASGPVESWYKRIANVTIFGVPVPSSVWSIIDLPASDAEGDGTIGYGFLKHFNITFDYQRRRVWLENFAGKVSSEELGTIGLSGQTNERTRRVQVVRVAPDSPAEKAGVKEDDEILAIDGNDLLGTVGYRQLSRSLEGPVGSTVKLAMSRKGQLMRLEIKRELLIND